MCEKVSIFLKKTVKNEPTDETVSSKNKSESAKCASAISVVEDDDDDDDGVERDKDEDVVLEKGNNFKFCVTYHKFLTDFEIDCNRLKIVDI